MPSPGQAGNRTLIAVTVAVGVVAALLVAAIVYFWPVTVPDIVKKSESDAEAMLGHTALSVGARGRVATTGIAPDHVVVQNPAAGSTAPRHSSVDMTLAVDPVATPVPTVVGLESARAFEVLAQALYDPQSIEVFGLTEPIGVVVDQLPAAGTSYVMGQPVVVAVSAGPDNGTAVKVPDVLGESLDSAQSKLASANLGIGGFEVDIETPESNVVVSQLPKGGVLVGPQTTVLLLLKTP